MSVMTLKVNPDEPLIYTGNWSFSSLMDYEACAFRFALARIYKMPRLPLEPDNPMERGNRIHNNLELFVKGEGSLKGNEARALKQFVGPLEHARELYAIDMATAEEDWIFDREWELTNRYDKDKYLWAKLDLSAVDKAERHIISVDYKSGKSKYKAIEHTQQLQLYAGLSALQYEWAEVFTSELWYVDEGHVKQFSATREQALMYIGRFDARAQKIYADRLFRPNPNAHNCRFCPFSKGKGTGACPVAAA